MSVFANCLWLNFGNVLNNRLALCTRILFVHLPIDEISIWQKLFVLSKCFRIKCTLDSDMLKALAISRIVYLPSLSIISLTFETLILPVAATSRPDSVASLTDSVPV